MYADLRDEIGEDDDMLHNVQTDTPTARPTQLAANLAWLSNCFAKLYVAFHAIGFVLNMAVTVTWAISPDVPPSYVITCFVVMGSCTLLYGVCFFAWHTLPSNYERPSASNNYQGRIVAGPGEGFVRRMLKHWFGEYVASFDDLHAFQERTDALTRDLVERCINLPVQREVISARTACSGAQMMLVKAILPFMVRSCTEAPLMGMIMVICCATGHLANVASSLSNLVYFAIFFSLFNSIPLGLYAVVSRPMVDFRSLMFIFNFGMYMCAGIGYYCVSVANRESLRENGGTIFFYMIFFPVCKILLDAILWTLTAWVFVNPSRGAQIGSPARESPIILAWFLEGEPNLEWRRWRAWAAKQADLIRKGPNWRKSSVAARAQAVTNEVRAAVAARQTFTTRFALTEQAIDDGLFSPWSLNPDYLGGKYRFVILAGFVGHLIGSVIIYAILPPRADVPISSVLAFFQFLPLLGVAALSNHAYRIVRLFHVWTPLFQVHQYLPLREVLAVMENYFVPHVPHVPEETTPTDMRAAEDVEPQPRRSSLTEAHAAPKAPSAILDVDFFDERDETTSVTERIAIEMQTRQTAVAQSSIPRPSVPIPALSDPEPAVPRPLWGPRAGNPSAPAPDHRTMLASDLRPLPRSDSLSSCEGEANTRATSNSTMNGPSRNDDLMETPSLLDNKSPRRPPSQIGPNRAW